MAKLADEARLGDGASNTIASTMFTRISTTIAVRNVGFLLPGRLPPALWGGVDLSVNKPVPRGRTCSLLLPEIPDHDGITIWFARSSSEEWCARGSVRGHGSSRSWDHTAQNQNGAAS